MVARTLVAAAVTLTLAAGCGNEYHPEYHPQTAYAYTQTVSQPVTIFQTTGHPPPGTQTSPGPAPAAIGGADGSRVLVLESKHTDRPSQVVGVVDAHEEMGKHEGALRTLQRKAAALGADAVVGVEFHHGEGEAEPTHLSGIAVRFLPSVRYPID